VLLIGTALLARAQETAAVVPLVDPDHRRMQPEAALSFSGTTLNVAGDPSKPGLYVIRRRFKPGEMSRPHMHNTDRLVTVITGTWWTGEGDVFSPEATVPIRAGGFMLHPAGLHHFDGAKDEEVIVQIIGMGPVTTTDTERR
jgi:gentisate 1,2-dioxygenase